MGVRVRRCIGVSGLMMIGRCRTDGSALDNAKGTPVDFEASRLEDGLDRSAFVGAGGQFVERANLFLEVVETPRKWLSAAQVNDDSIYIGANILF